MVLPTLLTYSKGGSLEIDIYGGFRTVPWAKWSWYRSWGSSISIIQEHKSSGKLAAIRQVLTPQNFTALLSYGWVQAKISGVVSKDAWGCW